MCTKDIEHNYYCNAEEQTLHILIFLQTTFQIILPTKIIHASHIVMVIYRTSYFNKVKNWKAE